MSGKRLYVAGPLGFATPGASWMHAVLLPRLRGAGWEVLDPWDLSEVPDLAGTLEAASLVTDLAVASALYADANAAIGRRNEQLIDRSDAVLAWLDGNDVDSGTAAEIGYAAGRGLPIVGVRTDFRSAGDNLGGVVNLQVEHFVRRNGGVVLHLPGPAHPDPVPEILEALASVGGHARGR